ncbi:hypothetical protein F5J12DRAFT_786591 [Pisolithus orientalis]|uniref:uncharacterized protein n=1 Tax=Pisolithus orientalis TaxID=936130 RepID=UPI002224D6C4|nr:uncharacterized protein F5J12DRAFT_786591 [Pisolithus orientalis]KAI5989781.1 hypothetical protein F5J12DRAFT_786591 [Pisolithus orientalis]
MSDYYWQPSKATDTQMDYITQVWYTVTSGAWQQGNYGNQTKQPERRRNHCIASGHLSPYSMVLMYYLLIELFLRFKENTDDKYMEFLPTLISNIVHLDNVIESLIRPCLNVPLAELPDYRSNNFDEYLVTEYLIGRHDPQSSASQWKDLLHSDWKAYSDRIPEPMDGADYDWDIEQLPYDDYEEVWDAVEEWYGWNPDPQWISRWVKWEDERMAEGEKEQHSLPSTAQASRFMYLLRVSVARYIKYRSEEGGTAMWKEMNGQERGFQSPWLKWRRRSLSDNMQHVLHVPHPSSR